MALLPDSPAIDAGDNDTCEITDQRGIARPQGANCDIGAFEYSATNPVWNTFLGGIGYDTGSNIYVDELGNIYVVGSSSGYYIDSTGSYSNPTWGNPIRAYFGDGKSDVFVAKLDSSGNLIWNTFLGGSEDDNNFIGGIVVDGNGNIYVTGNSSSSWGDPIQAHRNNGADGFIAKLNSSGTFNLEYFSGQ